MTYNAAIVNQLARQMASDSSVTCDICQISVQHFNRHMRSHHPGCGGNCGRHGYRSDSVYVDGWFGGICGTGNPYYLMCRECRERYMAKADEMRTIAAMKGTNM